MDSFHTDFKDLKEGYAVRYAVMQKGMCSRKSGVTIFKIFKIRVR